MKSFNPFPDTTNTNRYVKLVIYFDEAHTLRERTVKNKPTELSFYNFLVESYYIDYPLYVTSLSTSNAADGALQAPIIETPFACSPTLFEGLEPDQYTLKEVSIIEFMAQFGRPLRAYHDSPTGNVI